MGGGGGGQTQQQNQYSSVSSWAQPYVGSILGAAQQQVFNMNPQGQITGMAGYTPYGYKGAGMSPEEQAAAQSSVAGFTPLQQQAFTGASNLQTPGQFGQATGIAGAASLGSLGAGANYAAQATNPNAVGAYMNPYLSASLQPQLNEIQRQGDIAAQQAASRATASGAFGGTRGALAQNEAQRNALLAQQNAISQGYNQAFNQAQQAQQFGANLGLQGYGQALQGAGTLGQLGTSQLAAQQGILGTQNQYGTQQQQQQQNLINQAMQNYQTQGSYGMQQLQNLKNLISGFGVTDVTTTQEAAAPNAMSQLAGLAATGVGAAGAAGAFKAKGGAIKSYDVGGAVAADLENMDDARLMQEAKTSPSATIRRQAAQILAERHAAQGIEGAQSNLPVMSAADGGIMQTGDSNDGYAGGGMVAFERGGITELPVKRYSGVYPEGSFIFEDVYGNEPYGEGQMSKSMKKNIPNEEVRARAAANRAAKPTVTPKEVKTAADAVKGIEAAAPAGRAYTAARAVGSTVAKAPQLVAAGEVLGNLGSYKFQEPGLDTSVSGVYNAAKKGDYGQAWRNLYMGLPEAGMDLMRSAAGVGDIFLPGTPATDALDKRLKERWNVSTPSDKAAAPAPSSSPAPTPAPSAAPTAKKDDGIQNLIDGASGNQGIDAMFGNTPLGRLQAEAYKKVQEADLKQSKSKAQADLDKQREEIEANKGQKLWQALMMGGAKAMGATSPHALANVGEGISSGLTDYAKAEQAERAEKKLLLQYQTALDQADYAKKMGNFTALEQIQGRLAGLKIAAMNAASNKETALQAAYEKNFVSQVGEAMYKYGMTEDQAIAHVRKTYLAANKNLPQDVTVTQVKK